MEKKKALRARFRLLGEILHSSRKYFIATVLTGFLLTANDMVAPQIIRFGVDSVIGNAEPKLSAWLSRLLAACGGIEAVRERLWICAALIAFFGLTSAVLRYFYHTFDAKAGETLVKTIRDRLYDHIQRLPWSWHSANATGDIIQRCTSDVEVIKDFFQNQFVTVFRIVVMITLALVCMIRISLRLSLILIILIPIIVAYSLIFHNRIRKHFIDCDENEGILSTIAQENLTGVRVVRAFGRERFERDRFEAQNIVYTEKWVKLCRTLSWFWAIGDVTSGVQVMLVLVIGCVFCVRGEITAGELLAFISYNTMLVWPVRRLGRVISEMSKTGVSLDRVGYILDSEPERDLPDADERAMDGDIEFDHVSFSYTEGKEILHDVSFAVPAHSRFGILGGTGAGKTSLVHLLCRLYDPSSGEIRVGGKSIASRRGQWVRQNVGIVLQEPFLFSRTIAENISIAGGTAEELRAAAVTACIDADIREFPSGYDTVVGERGVTLSGGQKQRVAIARMLAKKTPILIFDDSLSAVDTETDESIRSALARDAAGCTQIIISHRITTLMDCDRILVLERGRVSQLGTPEELLRVPGIFRRIFELQMAVGEEEQA